MQFNSETNEDDIVSDIDFWAGSDISSYPLKAKARNANRALDKVIALILQADGRWEFDDSCHTDLPIGTCNLVSGQRDYGIAGATFLRVTKVLVKRSTGTWKVLNPVDEHDPEGKEIVEDRDSGTPRDYVKKASSIFLGPKPSYNSTSGLKVHFQRNIAYFAHDDTTKVPGFAAPFHRLISLYAARDYCVKEDFVLRLRNINTEIKEFEAGLIAFYSDRNRDDRPRIRLRKEDYGASSLIE